MSHVWSTRGAARARFLVVAAILALCLSAAAALASGWQGLISPVEGDPARGDPAPYLGITYVPLSHELAARYGLEVGTGVLVTDVAEVSPARRAGFRRGDILLGANSEPFKRPSALVELLMERRAGDRITFQLLRDGRTLTAELVLDARQ